MKNQPVLERFFDKVVLDKATGCWNFTSSISKSNCGRFYYNNKCRDAYKIGYILMGGEIPNKYDLHHVCENRLCVNPEHLHPVTKTEHHADLSPTHIAYKNKRKTHCPKGHPYEGDNLLNYQNVKGRKCRICAVNRSNECQKRKRAREWANGRIHKRFKLNPVKMQDILTSTATYKQVAAQYGISESYASALIKKRELLNSNASQSIQQAGSPQ